MALERFIPKSPDIFIRNSQDFEVAKFGHLNTIVEYINNNSAKPAGLNGYVQFNNNSALGGDAGLFWDNVNKRLGVGTVIPATTFQVNGVQALTNADLTGYPLYSIFNIVRNGATSIALDRFTGAPHFNFRAAGGTIASPTTQVGELGNIGWWSYSGTAFNRNVLLIARAENFVGGLAQTRRLSIGMGDSGSGTDYYYEMVNGNSYFGAGAYGSTPTARVQIKGSGSTSATTALLVQNSSGNNTLQVLDDASVVIQGNNTSATQLFRANNSTGNYAIRTTNAFSTSFGYFGAGDTVTILDGSVSSAFRAGLPLISPSWYAAYFSCASGDVRVGQSTSGTNANPSAILQCNTTTQGFLPPRMTTVQRNAIASPANGLIVFDTDVQNLCYRRDGVWVQATFAAV